MRPLCMSFQLIWLVLRTHKECSCSLSRKSMIPMVSSFYQVSAARAGRSAGSTLVAGDGASQKAMRMDEGIESHLLDHTRGARRYTFNP